MALSLDKVTQSSTNVAGNFSYSHTLSVNATSIVIAVSRRAGEASTAVTVGGIPATSLVTIEGLASLRTELWGLASPPKGAQTIAITSAATTSTLASSSSWIGSGTTKPTAFGALGTASGADPNTGLSITLVGIKPTSIAYAQIIADTGSGANPITTTVGKSDFDVQDVELRFRYSGGHTGFAQATMAWTYIATGGGRGACAAMVEILEEVPSGSLRPLPAVQFWATPQQVVAAGGECSYPVYRVRLRQF